MSAFKENPQRSSRDRDNVHGTPEGAPPRAAIARARRGMLRLMHHGDQTQAALRDLNQQWDSMDWHGQNRATGRSRPDSSHFSGETG